MLGYDLGIRHYLFCCCCCCCCLVLLLLMTCIQEWSSIGCDLPEWWPPAETYRGRPLKDHDIQKYPFGLVAVQDILVADVLLCGGHDHIPDTWDRWKSQEDGGMHWMHDSGLTGSKTAEVHCSCCWLPFCVFPHHTSHRQLDTSLCLHYSASTGVVRFGPVIMHRAWFWVLSSYSILDLDNKGCHKLLHSAAPGQ